jgi:hypothetical protein
MTLQLLHYEFPYTVYVGKFDFLFYQYIRPNPKKIMVNGNPMPELTLTSPSVHSRVDSNTFTMGNPMPESTLSPSQGLLDLTSGYHGCCKENIFEEVHAFSLSSVWLHPSPLIDTGTIALLSISLSLYSSVEQIIMGLSILASKKHGRRWRSQIIVKLKRFGIPSPSLLIHE